MAKLKDIAAFLDDYLGSRDIKDHSWNGLQLDGRTEVGSIAFAVDAGIETFTKAASMGADMVVVHHGMYWRSVNPSAAGWTGERVRLLLKHGMSLYASHLPLDRHPVVGNNAELIRLLGARITGEFGVYDGISVGWTGKFPKATGLGKIAGLLDERLNTRCKVLGFGPSEIKTVGVVSGGGGYEIFSEAVRKKVDLYITGDAIEVYHVARDAGINVIFAGHHATETVGLMALAKAVKKKFRIKTAFLDIRTGL